MAPDPQLIALAQTTAQKYNILPELVCAVIEQESSWNTWSIKFESAFFSKYVGRLYVMDKIGPTEAYGRGFSWGLMQVMGQVARECGFEGKFLSELCDPATGIDFGCRVLRKKFDAVGNDTERALLAYNGGGDPLYPNKVRARITHYPPAVAVAVVNQLADKNQPQKK